MTTLKERVGFILLPHNRRFTKLTKYLPNTLSLDTHKLAYHTNQYLYVISDRDVNDGDWCYYKPEEVVIKFDPFIYNKKYCSKIEATTDTTLDTSFPSVSTRFLERFVENYNK